MLKSKNLTSILLGILAIILLSCTNKFAGMNDIQMQKNANASFNQSDIIPSNSTDKNNETKGLPNTEFVKPSLTVLTPLAVIEVDDEDIVESDSGTSYIKVDYMKNFYSKYGDDYDFVAVYTDFLKNAGQHGGMVSYTIRGIGAAVDTTLDDEFRSKQRLQSIGFMGTLDEKYMPFTQDWTAYNILLEEAIAHRWGMYIGNFQDEGGHLPLQNTLNGGHWTPCMSFQRKDPKQPFWKAGLWHHKGNNIWAKQEEYNQEHDVFDPFMLYFMGFLPPERVPNATLIMPFGENKARQCVEKLTIQGTSRTISINDIISLYGPRDPSFKYSQKNFTMGFILLVRKGTKPSPAIAEAIKRWAAGFPKVFDEAVSTEYY